MERGAVWAGGGRGSRRRRVEGLVMVFSLVVAGGEARGGVCWGGFRLVGVVGGLRVVRRLSGPGGGGRRGKV